MCCVIHECWFCFAAFQTCRQQAVRQPIRSRRISHFWPEQGATAVRLLPQRIGETLYPVRGRDIQILADGRGY